MNYETVYQDFLKEFVWYHVGDAVKAFFGEDVHSTWTEKPGSENKDQYLTQDGANHLFWSDTPSAEYIRYILHDQYNFYKQYLDSVAKNRPALQSYNRRSVHELIAPHPPSGRSGVCWAAYVVQLHRRRASMQQQPRLLTPLHPLAKSK